MEKDSAEDVSYLLLQNVKKTFILLEANLINELPTRPLPPIIKIDFNIFCLI